MDFINYDEVSLQTSDTSKNDGEAVYADSTEIRPESGGGGSNGQDTGQDDNQDDIISDDNQRNKDAEKIVEHIDGDVSSPLEQLVKLKQKRPPLKSYSKPKSENCCIKDFPRELVQKVRCLFPGATNNTDALAAFVVSHLGEDISVSDTVDQLVSNYTKDDPIVSVDDRLHNLERQMLILVKGLSELELGLGYMIYDRLGYRDIQPTDARNTDMLESNRSGSVMDIIVRMREQSNQMRKQENIKNGRPIR